MKHPKLFYKQEQAQSDATRCARRSVVRFQEGATYAWQDSVIEECKFDLVIQGCSVGGFTCSPWNVEELAIGRMFLEGVIGSIEDVRCVSVDRERGRIEVELANAGKSSSQHILPVSGNIIPFERIFGFVEHDGLYSDGSVGCNRGPSINTVSSKRNRRLENAPVLSRVSSDLRVSAADVCRGISSFEGSSKLFHRTGGVHAAALADVNGVIARMEDIGRHSAMDKLVGWCVKNRMAVQNRFALFSGRVPQEIIVKVIRLGCPVIVSPGAPTSLSVDLAEEYGVTLVGFAKRDRFNVYSHVERIIGAESMAL